MNKILFLCIPTAKARQCFLGIPTAKARQFFLGIPTAKARQFFLGIPTAKARQCFLGIPTAKARQFFLGIPTAKMVTLGWGGGEGNSLGSAINFWNTPTPPPPFCVKRLKKRIDIHRVMNLEHTSDFFLNHP